MKAFGVYSPNAAPYAWKSGSVALTNQSVERSTSTFLSVMMKARDTRKELTMVRRVSPVTIRVMPANDEAPREQVMDYI